MLEDRLHVAPREVPSTLRLIRCRETIAGIVLSTHPVYLRSHWRNGRSYPCTKTLIDECPWCASTPARPHAYLGLLVTTKTTDPFKAIIELTPQSLRDGLAEAGITDPYAYVLLATRRHKKAPLEIHLEAPPDHTTGALKYVGADSMLRCLARVYGLPDPEEYDGEQSYAMALRARVFDAQYSPARSQPPPD